jgi:hypothetical protein
MTPTEVNVIGDNGNNGIGGFSPWQLDETDAARHRYTKSDVKRGNTEVIQCRADAFHVRRVDEIVASRIDPNLKTRSDVMQDALAMWLEDWDTRYPDGATGELSYQARIEGMRRKRRFRTDFLETAEEELRSLATDGDTLGLSTLLQTLLLAQGDFKDDAPQSYLDKLEKHISETKRLLAGSRMI